MNVVSVENMSDIPNFEKMMESKSKPNVVLVWFYADWCGHCKSMKDEWHKLESKCNQKKNKHLNIARVKDTMIPSLKNAPVINGYPTLKLFKNGNESEDYQGERKCDSLLNYLNKKTNNVSVKKIARPRPSKKRKRNSNSNIATILRRSLKRHKSKNNPSRNLKRSIKRYKNRKRLNNTRNQLKALLQL